MSTLDLEIDFSGLSDKDLGQVIEAALNEQKMRRIQDADPDALVEEALQSCFRSMSGMPSAPKIMAPGIVALPGLVKDTSADKHECSLFTIHGVGGEPGWSWDSDLITYLHSDKSKVGKVMRSVALHYVVPGMVVAQHVRSLGGDGRHSSRSMSAWRVTNEMREEGGISGSVLERLIDWVPGHLPPPIGEEDSNSFGKRQRQRPDSSFR